MKKSRFFTWGALLLSLALLSPALALAQGNGNGNGVNLRTNLQPVLIYTVMSGFLQGGQGGNGETGGGTGSGDNGAGLTTLIVYSNGMTVLSETGSDAGSGNLTADDNSSGAVQVSFISQTDINDLTRSLRQGGALRFAGLGRQDLSDTNGPLAILTIFTNSGVNGVSVARTIVMSPDTTQGGRAGQISTILENFATGSFSGFGGFGSGGVNSGTGSGS